MKFITLDQLAGEVGMSRKTLQNRISSGAPMPPSYKIGRQRLFKRDEVDAWIEQSRVETSLAAQIDGRLWP